MSIKSTSYITREHAISRIKEIAVLFMEHNYREIDAQSFEGESYGIVLREHVCNWTPIMLDGIENWTDEMLADYMDTPFFRHSMFENYLIKEE